MLIEKLKEVSENRKFKFEIGDEDWHNLIDANDDMSLPFHERQVYLLTFTDEEEFIYDGYGIQVEKYHCVFLLAVRSRLTDPNYQYKYDNHIKPLKDLAKTIRDEDFSLCDGITLKSYKIGSWKENYLDANFDCVEVKISIEYDG
jgi:hypothetical protein